MSNMLTADPRRNTNRTRVVLAFGLAGVASGWGSERILEWMTVASRTGPPHAIGRGALLLPGLLLLLGLITALAFCQGIGWLSVRHSGWRCLVAALLVTVNGLCGLAAGLLVVIRAGFAMAALGNHYVRGHPIFALVVVFLAAVIGIFSSVLVLSLALYVFAHNWHTGGWVALMLCGVGAAAISCAVLIPSWPRGGVASVDRFFQVLMFLTHTLYSGCAGYWLSQTPAS